MIRAPQAPPPSRSLAVSLAAHGALLGLALLLPRLHLGGPDLPPFEIEITSPFLGDGPAKLGAPKPFTPGVPARVNRTAEKGPETPKPAPLKPPPPPPQDWVLPKPGVKPPPAPPPPPAATGVPQGTGPQTTPGGAPGGEGTAAKVGGSGEGSDEGVVGGHGHGGTPLSAFPVLLNKDEVLASLRRYYPEAERRAGREGDVIAVIHISADGSVNRVEIGATSAQDFGDAAVKVGRLMRFSPALGLNGKPVPVRMPQRVEFRLSD